MPSGCSLSLAFSVLDARYEGRTTGSRGSALAQAFIARKFREAKLQSFAAEQTFVVRGLVCASGGY